MKKIIILVVSLIGVYIIGTSFSKEQNHIVGKIQEISGSELVLQVYDRNYVFSIRQTQDLFSVGDFVEVDYIGELEDVKEVVAMKEPSSLASIIPISWQDTIFQEYNDIAYQMLSQMTLEEKIGQMILARLPEEEISEVLEQYHLGGFVLFTKDFKELTKVQVQEKLQSYQLSSKIPLLLATDEEGGNVARVSRNPLLRTTPFQAPQQIYTLSGLSGIIEDTKEKIQLLRELGVNVNLAPVADVSVDLNDYIYSRSLGKDAHETAHYIKEVVKVYQQENFGCTLKHFPGYGNTQDTHHGIALDNREYATFIHQDFIPFQAGIDIGVPSILVSHNIVIHMDSEYPASLSQKVHQILREQLKFTGIIMTDDLSMGAITNYTDSPVERAVLAGNDILLVTDFRVTYDGIMNGIKKGTITEEMIDQAVFRILGWKYQLGLL